MRYIVVRKRGSLEIVASEEIDSKAYPSVEEMAKAVAQKITQYEKKFPYPEFEILSGRADSPEELFS